MVSGSGGGLVMQAAAVIAGKNPANMVRLPDTTGMKDEIIIHRSHRFGYDQLYRAAGAKFVEIGDGRRCYPWQLEAAFTENTAAVAYLYAQFVSRRSIPLPQVCEIAHGRGGSGDRGRGVDAASAGQFAAVYTRGGGPGDPERREGRFGGLRGRVCWSVGPI